MQKNSNIVKYYYSLKISNILFEYIKNSNCKSDSKLYFQHHYSSFTCHNLQKSF